MIEFTLSRVMLIVCGVAILAAIAVPIQSFYDVSYDSSMEDTADHISFILDEFWASNADTMTIRGWEILPSSDCSIEIEDHKLTVLLGDRTYHAMIAENMDKIVIGYGDVVTISKNEPSAAKNLGSNGIDATV
ncbi:MAG: hypothetical protein FWC52_04535 [Candidatus Methanoplasma sp.]|nr:hypothetical protein [Candidatus Methanoplasma sp.]